MRACCYYSHAKLFLSSRWRRSSSSSTEKHHARTTLTKSIANARVFALRDRNTTATTAFGSFPGRRPIQNYCFLAQNDIIKTKNRIKKRKFATTSATNNNTNALFSVGGSRSPFTDPPKTMKENAEDRFDTKRGRGVFVALGCGE